MEERFRILMEEGDQMGAVEEAKIQKVIFLLNNQEYSIDFCAKLVVKIKGQKKNEQ